MSLKPEQVCLIYLLKHMDSIRNYVLTGSEVSEEPITSRIQDARNYLLLLGGIIEEKRKKVKRKNQLHLMQKHLVNLIKYKLYHNIKKF